MEEDVDIRGSTSDMRDENLKIDSGRVRENSQSLPANIIAKREKKTDRRDQR